MKSFSVLRLSVAGILMAAFPVPSMAQISLGIGINVGFAPPAIPVYQQPYVPGPNYLWVPGYWSWAQYGYYWVPGTWAYAPQPGYLWTPGYWGWNAGNYAWNQGYWGRSVGFYGGVNYGAGYYGNGYVGGQWSGNNFSYNNYVTRVGPGFGGNVYANRNVYVNNATTSTVSYNGGPNGLQTVPTQYQLAAGRAQHVGMTAAQQQNVQVAAQDRNMLASVNHNQPAVMSVARPLSASNHPAGFAAVRTTDRVSAQAQAAHTAPIAYRAPAAHAAPAYRAPAAPAAPAYHAPAVHAAPAYHAPAGHAAPAYHAPAVHAAPAYHAPAVRAAPAYHAPAYHAPAAHAAPPNRAPAAHARPAGAGDDKQPR
jgi:hypothetical protein